MKCLCCVLCVFTCLCLLFVIPSQQAHQVRRSQVRRKPNATFPPFDYSEIPFLFVNGQNQTAFFEELSIQVMRRAWVWDGTDCKELLAPPFCRFLQRLDARQCVSIFVIGGSTTLGVGVNGRLWYDLLEDWMNYRFPCDTGNHSITAYALSGAGSNFHLGVCLFCVCVCVCVCVDRRTSFAVVDSSSYSMSVGFCCN